MKNRFLTKNFVKLTEDQSMLLGHIDDQLKELRKKNLSKLNDMGSKMTSAPELADTIAASIYLYQKSEEKSAV